MLVSGIFNSLGPLLLFLMVWTNIRRWGMLSSSDEVYDDGISWNYVLLSVTYKFGLGKWAKIERNDGKQLCVKTSLVDWSVYTWAQWVSKTIRQDRMGLSLLIAPVGNVLMRLGCLAKGTEDFSKQWLFSNLETIIVKATLVPVNSFLFWLTSFKKDTIFYYINLMHRLCTKL